MTNIDNSTQVFKYHQETKHQPQRYARSLGYLDWSNQPDPFRRYEGAPLIELPLLTENPEGNHLDLYQPRNSKQAPFTLSNIGGFLELSLGLSAWKSVGENRWALRINPSSGNLHPTECHLLLPSLKGYAPGVYHYAPYDHTLEERIPVSRSLWEQTETHFGCRGFAAALTSIFWRESWKYGERALRYTQHDVGHALCALSVAANLFGWKLTVLHDMSDRDISRVLALNRIDWRADEAEHPDLFFWVHGLTATAPPPLFSQTLIEGFEACESNGTPNPLSAETVEWKIIDETSSALKKPRTDERSKNVPTPTPRELSTSSLLAAHIIRQRRSAQRFSSKGRMDKSILLSMLDKTLSRSDCAPFHSMLGPTRVDLLLFVHQITGIRPGIYLFDRTGNEADALRQHVKGDFEWQGVKDSDRLFRLETGDVRKLAAAISCHQDIAGDCAVSLGMLARFSSEIVDAPWRYKNLFWETGMIGQILYLEAEAHGFRGCGIGCFFDDAVHRLLGLKDNTYQSLYHFAIGIPIEDTRLTTLPAYHHIERLR